LVDEHHARLEHQELLVGIVAAEIRNSGMRAPRKAAVPADFMPSQRAHKVREPKRLRRSDGQRVSDDIRTWLDAMRASGMVIRTNG